MRFQPGILFCLLAGCAVQPTSIDDRWSSDDSAREVAAREAANRAALQRLADGNRLRIGVEFLPPAAEENAVAVVPAAARAQVTTDGEPPRRPVGSIPVPLNRDNRDRHTWTLSNDDLAAMRAPLEQETLRFLDDVMGEDRRRLRRELGTPILSMQTIDLQSPGLDLPSEEEQAEERAEWLTQNGMVLLRRPFQNLLRRFPTVREFEIELDEFKSTNLPLSETYGPAPDRRNDVGRVSMHIRANNPRDPVELAWVQSNVRVGTSQGLLKVGLAQDLAENLTLEVRTRHAYDSSDWRVRADLTWRLSRTTSLHLVAGDDLDFMATSSVYSLFDSPMDGSPGLLIYAVHLF